MPPYPGYLSSILLGTSLSVHSLELASFSAVFDVPVPATRIRSERSTVLVLPQAFATFCFPWHLPLQHRSTKQEAFRSRLMF